MKNLIKKISLSVFALSCFIALSGFSVNEKHSKVVLHKQLILDTSINLPIYLPYSGRYNEWTITFHDVYSSDTYILYSNNSTFNSGILGTVPYGTYNIEFDCPYFPLGFDFGVYSDTNGITFGPKSDSFTKYNQVIDAGSYIQIDEGY